MKEELIQFETAKLAKEKGFNDGQLYYNKNEEEVGHEYYYVCNESDIKAPTQALLQRWLREEHEMQVYVKPLSNKTYSGYVDRWGSHLVTSYIIHEKHEQALEVSLQEALKLIP